MPKILTPAMRAHLDAETTRLAAIWRITRKDGQQSFFTDHDRDIVFGGDTYRADAGFARTAIRSDAGFAVDNLDLVGVFAEGGIVEDEVRAGLFDGAEIAIAFVNWQDPDGHGEIRLRRGTLGETRLTPHGYFTAEIRGLAQPLMQNTLQLITPECRVDLGGAACSFPIWPDEVARNTAYALGAFVRASDPPGGPLAEDYHDRIYECVVAGTTHAATQPTYDTTIGNDTVDGTATFRAYDAWTRAAAVAALTNDRVLEVDDSLDAYADGWFDEGLLVWETGANAGVAYEVKAWTEAGRALELWEAARLGIEVGDKFRTAPGCHKRVLEDCRDRFRIPGSLLFDKGNVRNFRGEPYVPGSPLTAVHAGRGS
jgi:hypothetical protein